VNDAAAASDPAPVNDLRAGPGGPVGGAGPVTNLGPAQLGQLALARGSVDHVTDRRQDADWVAAAWRDPRTRVLVLADGEAPVSDAGELVFVPPAQAPEGIRVLLGIDTAAVAYFAVLVDQQVDGPGQLPAGARTAGLRQVGAQLTDRDAGLLTEAVALANWHSTHTHCPRCGALTKPAAAGHTRICPVDGSEHFPRVDPAVIMLVLDPGDRALLARNRRWPERRVSILAGFVEPGESVEQAVAREVGEEVGIAVREVRYLGSQPWPMPRSLMLGFAAEAAGNLELRVDAEEIAEAAWYTRDELRAAVASGQLRLPPSVSIARRILESWYGSRLPG